MVLKGIREYSQLALVSSYLRRTFELWGYGEVVLPTIEPYGETLRGGTKFAYNNRFYLIKPDVTSRLLRNYDIDFGKLYYIGEVLDGGVEGRWQAGVEFIGGEPAFMTAEVLSVLITALESLGIEEFYIDLGSLEVWRRATEGIEDFRETICRALERRNFGLIEKLPLDEEKKEELWRLFNFRGRETDYGKLARILGLVDDERVFVDLGTVRPLPYYRDVIFEVYSPEIGRPIGGGGEYSFRGRPAVGFALDLRALIGLAKVRERGSRRFLRGISSFREARKLVSMGVPVEVER
ncbi:ATP phosphoribosyltransferase regulatory subunit [Thermococcus sp. 21S9]|uniref:ATP phosphoribosyltransferase regulatory subunit n=1 Tax=Thermococcus sp. 21S9 TaxID=1638223 RepID=UPI00143B3602|nr:ATP phosphoribosyltransferase regulatory subunit [Thermococcus sp. 21S9]NJE55467.1 ATP phosphoribosyltransferase regulatory subunit [Thermococcus sp. 21S9]